MISGKTNFVVFDIETDEEVLGFRDMELGDAVLIPFHDFKNLFLRFQKIHPELYKKLME